MTYFTPYGNLFESHDGFCMEILDPYHIKYSEELKTMRIYVELLMSPAGWTLDPDSIKSWEPPYDKNKIDGPKRDEIIENIKTAFHALGHEIEIAESGLAYHGSWPVLSKDELESMVKEKKKIALRNKAAGIEPLGAKIIRLDAGNFMQEVLNSRMPVLVFVWASPFEYSMGQVLEEVSIEWEGKIKICQLNYDESQEIVRKYQIKSIPTMILFKEGKPEKKIVGLWPKEALVREFQPWLRAE